MTLEAYFGITTPLRPQSQADVIPFPQRRSRIADAEWLHQRASAIDEDPKRLAEATLLYEQALRLDPNYHQAWTNLGNILYHLKLEDRAKECYSAALAIDPNQPEASFNLGVIAYGHEDYEDAMRRFENAVSSDPQFADAHFYLGYTLAELDQTARAAAHLALFLSLDGTSSYAESARELLEKLNRR